MHAWEYQYYPSAKNKLAPLLFRLFYPWADTIVAVSHAAAQDIATMSGIPRDRVKVIYNPATTPALLEKAQEPLDHPWFASGQPPVILAVGRLFKVKDFATLIRAFALVCQQRPARLMILGEGEERPALEALVQTLGIQDDVALPGFTPNPYVYMRHAAVFVLSSLSESFSNVVVEALAVGTPVISTDFPGGTREILDNGRYGTLVPVGDAQAMAAAICATLDEPPDSAALRQRANDFSLEKSFAQYAEVLLGRQWAQQHAQQVEQS
jgi:glycosyltransferase involved in cell wall biosynthesis